jgi:hypothetical protein
MNVISRIQTVSLVKFKKPSRGAELRSQAEARRIHFMQRFRERVGYKLTREKYNELLCIVSVSGRFMYKREGEVGSVYNVIFNGSVLKVVYDVFTQSLITVLSPPNK